MVALGVDSVKMLAAAYPVISDLEKYPERANLFAFRSSPLAPGGSDAHVEATRALVAVDVNTGNDTSLAAGLKANIALARELPRQLALRGLGGQIVVDFAPMPKRDRATLDQVLQGAFRGAGSETTLVGWTAMGLYELTRKRDRVPLARLASASGDV